MQDTLTRAQDEGRFGGIRGLKTINEIGQEYGVHPGQVGQWKKTIQEQAQTLFQGKRGPKSLAKHRVPELLYSEIGKLKVELDWLKKSLGSACHDAASVNIQGGCGERGTAMRFGGGITRHCLCASKAEAGRRQRFVTQPPDRLRIHAAPVLRQPQDGGLAIPVGQFGIKAHRPHQSLGHNTFDVVYQTAIGGSAMILDKYPRAVEEPTVPLHATECSATAKARSDTSVTNEEKVKPGQRRSAVCEVNCTA